MTTDYPTDVLHVVADALVALRRATTPNLDGRVESSPWLDYTLDPDDPKSDPEGYRRLIDAAIDTTIHMLSTAPTTVVLAEVDLVPAEAHLGLSWWERWGVGRSSRFGRWTRSRVARRIVDSVGSRSGAPRVCP